MILIQFGGNTDIDINIGLSAYSKFHPSILILMAAAVRSIESQHIIIGTMRASAAASASTLRSLSLSASGGSSFPVVSATEVVLDVLTWVVVVLFCVVLYKLHAIYRRRSGYHEIKQDDHVLYSQSLMGTKDSWETIPLAERKA